MLPDGSLQLSKNLTADQLRTIGADARRIETVCCSVEPSADEGRARVVAPQDG